MARRIKSMLKDMYDQIGERMNPRHMESCMKQLTKLNEIFDKI